MGWGCIGPYRHFIWAQQKPFLCVYVNVLRAIKFAFIDFGTSLLVCVVEYVGTFDGRTFYEHEVGLMLFIFH